MTKQSVSLARFTSQYPAVGDPIVRTYQWHNLDSKGGVATMTVEKPQQYAVAVHSDQPDSKGRPRVLWHLPKEQVGKCFLREIAGELFILRMSDGNLDEVVFIYDLYTGNVRPASARLALKSKAAKMMNAKQFMKDGEELALAERQGQRSPSKERPPAKQVVSEAAPAALVVAAPIAPVVDIEAIRAELVARLDITVWVKKGGEYVPVTGKPVKKRDHIGLLPEDTACVTLTDDDTPAAYFLVGPKGRHKSNVPAFADRPADKAPRAVALAVSHDKKGDKPKFVH